MTPRSLGSVAIFESLLLDSNYLRGAANCFRRTESNPQGGALFEVAGRVRLRPRREDLWAGSSERAARSGVSCFPRTMGVSSRWPVAPRECFATDGVRLGVARCLRKWMRTGKRTANDAKDAAPPLALLPEMSSLRMSPRIQNHPPFGVLVASPGGAPSRLTLASERPTLDFSLGLWRPIARRCVEPRARPRARARPAIDCERRTAFSSCRARRCSNAPKAARDRTAKTPVRRSACHWSQRTNSASRPAPRLPVECRAPSAFGAPNAAPASGVSQKPGRGIEPGSRSPFQFRAPKTSMPMLTRTPTRIPTRTPTWTRTRTRTPTRTPTRSASHQTPLPGSVLPGPALHSRNPRGASARKQARNGPRPELGPSVVARLARTALFVRASRTRVGDAEGSKPTAL